MNKNISFIFVLTVLAPISLFFLFFLGHSFAATTPPLEKPACPEPPPAPSCNECPSYSDIEYQCIGECPDAKIQKRERTCQRGRTGTAERIKDDKGCTTGWRCVNWISCDSCPAWPPEGGWNNHDTCFGWQKCIDDASLKTKPSCQCAGQCLETPKNPRYYYNPNYPTDPANPEPSQDPNNILLPVKLDWDDVAYWKALPDGPQSYRITIGNTRPTDPHSNYSLMSKFIPPSCTLKSNTIHPWQVQSCCTVDGQNCGPASSWSFTTSSAPEPILPFDPDWQGLEKMAENEKLNLILRWCPFYFQLPERGYQRPMSYRLFFHKISYRIESGKIKIIKEECHPELRPVLPGQNCRSKILRTWPGRHPEPKFSNKDHDHDFFTKEDRKGKPPFVAWGWQVSACRYWAGTVCSEKSQKWLLSIEDTLSEPVLFSPPNDPAGKTPIGLPVLLKWHKFLGTNSWNYQIYERNQTTPATGTTQVSNLRFDCSELKLDTFYTWRVQPCWDYEGKKCEAFWSEDSIFRTTGRPPELIYPLTNANNVPIPVNFKWEDVPGAKSYIFKYIYISKIEDLNLSLKKILEEPEIYLDPPHPGLVLVELKKILEKPGVSLDYPDLILEKDYFWRVKTCARAKGELCGPWSPLRTFKTFKLQTPINPKPGNNTTVFTGDRHFFSWDKVDGAGSYQFKIKYIFLSEEENKPECRPKVNQEIIKIIPLNSQFYPLECKGEYQWQVRACLDKDCRETGKWSDWFFNLTSRKAAPGWGGLVPCGRDYDNPDTDWNETDSCQLKHIFIMVKSIIDFFLWRVAPLILVVLVVISALILYFSLGKAEALIQIKSLWKSAGIGYLVIFTAWFLVSFVLLLFGYQVGLFGPWWRINF